MKKYQELSLCLILAHSHNKCVMSPAKNAGSDSRSVALRASRHMLALGKEIYA